MTNKRFFLPTNKFSSILRWEWQKGKTSMFTTLMEHFGNQNTHCLNY